jgi:hypothetical protein
VPSKYEKVFPTLKKLPVDDLSYQAKADFIKDQILHATESPDDLVVHEYISESLENIGDEVKSLMRLLINAPRGRRHAAVFGRYWLELRRIEGFLEEQLKAARLLLYAYDQLGVEQFEAEGVDILKFDELGTRLLDGLSEPDGLEAFVNTKLTK